MGNVVNIIERIEQHGILVSAEDGKLVLEGNVQALTSEQMEWIKANKPAILNELRQRVVARLGALAKARRVPIDDLMDWYRDDMEAMTRIDDETLAWLVEDYATMRSFYRRDRRHEQAA